ncbi:MULTISPECIES: hypothetical protein [unclassified Variovorax]|uniref:hypothetical protein n=1 Tax=unclassified Variovorax TaxID=663243 RepID=UPI003F45D1CF
MRLLSSTKELIISGRSYPGFPILLWDSMESCTETNEFFRYYLFCGAIAHAKRCLFIAADFAVSIADQIFFL